MTREQIGAEKVALQKALLYYEGIHGRPVSVCTQGSLVDYVFLTFMVHQIAGGEVIMCENTPCVYVRVACMTRG